MLDLTWCGAWLGEGGCGVAWWMGRLVVDRDSRPSGKGLFFLGTVDPVHWSQPSPGVPQTALEWPARTGLSPWTPWPHQLFIRTPGWSWGQPPGQTWRGGCSAFPGGVQHLGFLGEEGGLPSALILGAGDSGESVRPAHFPLAPARAREPAPAFPATGHVALCSWRTFGDPRGLSQALRQSHFLADHSFTHSLNKR